MHKTETQGCFYFDVPFVWLCVRKITQMECHALIQFCDSSSGSSSAIPGKSGEKPSWWFARAASRSVLSPPPVRKIARYVYLLRSQDARSIADQDSNHGIVFIGIEQFIGRSRDTQMYNLPVTLNATSNCMLEKETVVYAILLIPMIFPY